MTSGAQQSSFHRARLRGSEHTRCSGPQSSDRNLMELPVKEVMALSKKPIPPYH